MIHSTIIMTIVQDEEMVALTSEHSPTTTNSTATSPTAVAALSNNSSNDKATSPTTATSVTLLDELWASTDLIFQSKFTLLLLLGPLAVLGDATGLLGEAACFAFSGISLIPLAERLSFITEQVAEHTNGTIGALLNATFGNAPELLISVAALRSGYYRVVQLTMLGSMFTNMILVFGIACLIGGLRWQVQDLRTTSGNVNVVMLLLATAGSLFPSALVMTGQLPGDAAAPLTGYEIPSDEEVIFSRVNAAVMLILYVCYLIFQLGTHKEEFDDDLHRGTQRARRNIFCRSYMGEARRMLARSVSSPLTEDPRGTLKARTSDRELDDLRLGPDSHRSQPENLNGDTEHTGTTNIEDGRRRRRKLQHSQKLPPRLPTLPTQAGLKLKSSMELTSDFSDDSEDEDFDEDHSHPGEHSLGPLISLRVGIAWLFIITLCVSAITDVLVDTIDGFAVRMRISEVFTSMVIIPFFSNVAEQVSAFIFAYRNEMDLCVGVTVGSAIQIATFVLPGSVLIGMAMDRSMTLFFRGYETVSLFFGVVVVAAVMQGGTTNWLVGIILIGVYIIFAAGIWFHEVENLSIDAEDLIVNVTGHL